MAWQRPLIKVKDKGTYRQWKQGHLSQEEYRDAIQTCIDGIRRAEAQMEMCLTRNVKNPEGILQVH